MAVVEQGSTLMKEIESCPQLQGVSPDKRMDHLHSGVFFDQQKKKYWVDKNTAHNCFMLYARNLSITHGNDKRYWSWPFVKESNSSSNHALIEVAELLNVCWLEIQGKFDTSHLSSETTYEVVFEVKLKRDGCGYEHPVTLKLELPNGEKHEHKERLENKPREEWIELRVGEFRTCPCDQGDMHFSMMETVSGQWKKGLVVKGAIIRSKGPRC